MPSTKVTVPAGDEVLAATLTTPAGPGPYPAALLLAGSGPLDRDGDHKRLPLGLSKDLAAALGAAGWATLRFDKRGVGESTGDYLRMGFMDELGDAGAALEWLAARDDVTTVVPIGHSAGALFAAELAARGKAPDGAVLLAPTAKTGRETLVWQAGRIGASVPRWVKRLLALFGTSIEQQQAKALAKIEATSDDVARIQGQRVNAKWMREFLAYDPKPALGTVTSPVLALTGSKDVQVDPADIEVIAGLLGDRETALVIDDVDHILRHEPAALSDPKRYKRQIAEPVDGRVIDAVVQWLPLTTASS